MITDEMMSQAAAELAKAINRSLPVPSECNHEFSAIFERKIKRLMRKTNHPVMYRALRTVASIILVIFIGFGSILTVSAEARAIVFGWVRQQYDSFYEYFFDGNSIPSEPRQYSPGWIPDGYELVKQISIENGEMYVYYKGTEAVAQFTYSTSPSGLQIYFEGVDYEHQEIQVNGLPGDIYIAPSNLKSSEIVWKDKSGNTIFLFSARVSKDELIKFAENIQIKNN